MNFDAIIIGAGNGGLISALTLQKSGKKVLLLESHNLPGGVATSFVRGRFEFEASLHELCQYGTKEDKGEVQKLFTELNLADKLEFEELTETFHVLTIDDLKEYTLPVDMGPFIEKMEEYVPGSKTSMVDFFELCKEIKEALNYLNESQGKPDIETLKTNYSNFMKVAPYSVEKVLEALKMPKKAQEILSSYWVYLGSPTSQLSFVHYASMLYSYIVDHPVIPKYRSHDISLTIYEEFLNCGGTAKFLTPVTKILVENNIAIGVQTSDNTYYSKVIISNASPNAVYSKLIDQSLVPKQANQLVNARKLGARGICVYLGLNKSIEELGLNNYTYFIYHTLNSSKEFDRMKHLKGDNLVATVLNNAITDASPYGTTILTLTSLIFSEAFDETVTKNNYFELKNAFAKNLIEVFENATHLKISDAIEEIEIATPLTFARYTNHPSGTIYGYLAKDLDNLLPRFMNYSNEQYIKGLYFVGGFAKRLSGYSSTYLSGYETAKEALLYLKEDPNEN